MAKKFSERYGYTESPQTIQVEEMNDALRNSLWNLFHEQFDLGLSDFSAVAKAVSRGFFKSPVHEISRLDEVALGWISQNYERLEWYEVYDFMEFIARHSDKSGLQIKYSSSSFANQLNHILERELSGYRFVGDSLVPITNPSEVVSISEAISDTDLHGLNGANEHLETALKMLGKKPTPDYRNAIKEAISAVESLCNKLTAKKSSGLKEALNELEKYIQIHGAMKQGFLKLYGYTSDQYGIRHAIFDEQDVGYHEAKYMIVSCSAFINFIIGKAIDCGLLDDNP